MNIFLKFRVLKSKISVLLLLLSAVIHPQKDIKVISSDYNSILIEFTSPLLDSNFINIDGESYFDINLPFGEVSNPEEWGMPSIQERSINIGVPSEFGNTIEVISGSYTDIEGLISPIPGMVKDAGLDKVVYKISENYYNYTENPELVTFGEFGITRGIGTQIIKILPVKFNPINKTIRLYNKILFRVNYSRNRTETIQPYDELLSSSMVNYETARFWQNAREKLSKEITNSVLAEGEWVRFETGEEEGIYRIDYNFLTTAGLEPASIDPRTIKLYNNGGKVLPEDLDTERPIDLQENAIKIVGEDDGIFNQGDYILFYGRGTNFWGYDDAQGKIRRFHHPYSEKNYYWLTYGGAVGKRIADKPGLSTPAGIIQTTSVAFADNEDDRINLGKTGRLYLGDDFSTSISSRTYVNQLNGRISSTPIEYAFSFVVASEDGVTLTVTENGAGIFAQYLNGYSASYTVGNLHLRQASFNSALPDNRSVLKFTVSPSSVSAVGYIDYFEISFVKELKAFDDKLLFFSPDTSAVVEYFINNFTTTGIDVYDVSDYKNVKLISNHIQLSGGDCRFRVEENENSISKYYAVANNKYLLPLNPVSVNNSNIRGIQNGAEYIIITSDEFSAPADRLKNYRENDALITVSTTVINIDDIYNEFSCGVVDPTAVRDFVKYAYDNWSVRPAYLLLLGKGTYDYKNTTEFNDNFVPTWQTVESLRLLSSYVSDDYFVNVDGTDSNIDLAAGRLSVSSETEADNYVSKVIDYEQNSKKSRWKNLITLVADDGLTTSGNELWEHTRPTETIANDIIPESFDLNKIYLADYPAVITGGGRRKPTVNEKIIKSINDGTLLINYIGHGNPEVWAHEIVFERSSTIPQLNNSEYFFLVAATCDFGYYDIPNFESAAEELIFKPNSGAIGALNSARLVFSGANHALNNLFLTKLLDSPRDTLNLIKPIGVSYFATKKERNNSTNDRKYHLFADPLLRLQVPTNTGRIDAINNQPLIAEVQIKALSNTSISGTILTPDSEPWTDFSGEGVLTVFDSQRLKLLEQIGNEPMVIPGGIIFRGSISVVNGEFDASFVVPKDILYENENGKIIFYFFNNNTDGIAYTRKIIVGGTDTTAVNDGEGPEIEIFFDDANMYNSYLVGPEPKLIVKLSDETGLNTTGTGVGHKLEGILNEDESSPIDFTNYFKGELDAGGKAGEIEYKFSRLDEGDYHLRIKAWDVFNNFSSEQVDFKVVADDQLVIQALYNYPNPFSEKTTFTFQHNLTSGVDVKINIYTISGRKIKEIERKNIDQKYVRIDWNGRDEDGDIISNGTYLYKVIVKTVDGDFSQSVLGKLAVIR